MGRQVNSKVRKKARYVLAASLIWFGALGNHLQAHEFWLAPYQFDLTAGESLQADLKVGQNFEGESLPFITSSFTVSDQTEAVSITPRFASFPALNHAPPFEGLNIVSYESKHSTLTYESEEKFHSFLREDGLEWVIEEHRSRKLPPAGFTEAYRRFVKSLVNAGDKDFSERDRQVGQMFELVLQEHPFSQTEVKTAQLFLKGEPLKDTQITVFRKVDQDVSRQVFRTDNQGRVQINTGGGGVFLLNAVHMVEPDKEIAQMTNAVWESLWASLTFETPAK